MQKNWLVLFFRIDGNKENQPCLNPMKKTVAFLKMA